MAVLSLCPGPGVDGPGRPEITDAARAHLESGDVPSLAGVARAVGAPLEQVRRWFPSESALLVEAALLGGLPDADAFFDSPGANLDMFERVERAGLLVHRVVSDRARALPADVLERVVDLVLGSGDFAESDTAVEIALIDVAMQPFSASLAPTTLRQLTRSIVLFILARSLLAARSLDDLHLRRTAGEIAWACRTLVSGALISPG